VFSYYVYRHALGYACLTLYVSSKLQSRKQTAGVFHSKYVHLASKVVKVQSYKIVTKIETQN